MTREIHLGSRLDAATLEELADFICGDDDTRFPRYRTGSDLTRFFQSVNINAHHDGTTRKKWVLEILRHLEPAEAERVVLRLVDLREYRGDQTSLGLAARTMNQILTIESMAVTFVGTRPTLTDGAQVVLDEKELLKAPPPAKDEATFLKQQFADEVVIGDLRLDPDITAILQSRVDEAQACPRGKAEPPRVSCSQVGWVMAMVAGV